MPTFFTAKDAVRLQKSWVHVPTFTRTHTGPADKHALPTGWATGHLQAQRPAGPAACRLMSRTIGPKDARSPEGHRTSLRRGVRGPHRIRVGPQRRQSPRSVIRGRWQVPGVLNAAGPAEPAHDAAGPALALSGSTLAHMGCLWDAVTSPLYSGTSLVHAE